MKPRYKDFVTTHDRLFVYQRDKNNLLTNFLILLLVPCASTVGPGSILIPIAIPLILIFSPSDTVDVPNSLFIMSLSIIFLIILASLIALLACVSKASKKMELRPEKTYGLDPLHVVPIFLSLVLLLMAGIILALILNLFLPIDLFQWLTSTTGGNLATATEEVEGTVTVGNNWRFYSIFIFIPLLLAYTAFCLYIFIRSIVLLNRRKQLALEIYGTAQPVSPLAMRSEIIKDESWQPCVERLLAKRRAIGEGSAFTGGAFMNFSMELLVLFVSAVSLGFAYPAMICHYLRWRAQHTYYNGKQLAFDGKGSELFGPYMLWSFLSAVTFGIYGVLCAPSNMQKWIAIHTHFYDEPLLHDGELVSDEIPVLTKARPSKFVGTMLQMFGVNLVVRLVSLVTLGIGSFWAHCYRERWYTEHTVIDGERLHFDGTGIEYFEQRIKWLLLTVVTFGVYALWMNVKSKNWTISHTHIDKIEETDD